MNEYLPGLSALQPPPLIRVRQRFAGPTIADPSAALAAALAASDLPIRAGQTVALAIGSRGIAGLPVLVKTLVDAVRSRGAKAFIVPAMGSHGGATAEGQRDVLARFGVTEATVGAPIRSSMDAVRIDTARAEDGSSVDVFMDAIAHREADWILPLARVKPHTSFRGPYESGLCKMLVIGLGKHEGCSRLHRLGYDRFAGLIPAGAKVAIDSGKVAGVVAIIENASEASAHIEVVPTDRILAREPELLDLARSLMPRILMPEIDVLVVEEIGKDISGVGMDSNVTGRGTNGLVPGFGGPRISRIVVLGLSAATHGNAAGIGLADMTTRAAADAIDRDATYTNILTSGSLANGKIPVAMPTEAMAIMGAASCVPGVEARSARIVRIRNTLHLNEIAVSENLAESVRAIPGCEVLGRFDGKWGS